MLRRDAGASAGTDDEQSGNKTGSAVSDADGKTVSRDGCDGHAGKASNYTRRPEDEQQKKRLLGLEETLGGLGLDPETLKLMDTGSLSGIGETLISSGEGGKGLFGALAELKEAEERAQCAAGILEELCEDSPVAGQVFDLLLRRYLRLRDSLAAEERTESIRKLGRVRDDRIADAAAVDGAAMAGAAAESFGPAESHSVMAAVVVLAEKLGARVFGTGIQMLSCIRLVLEHEQPSSPAPKGERRSNGSIDGTRNISNMLIFSAFFID